MERSREINGIWWVPRNVRYQGNEVIPVPPYKPYDPFDFYHRKGLGGTTRSTRSLHYDFLDVDPNNIDSILQFCRRYGVLGAVAQYGWLDWSSKQKGLLLQSRSSSDPYEQYDHRYFPQLSDTLEAEEIQEALAMPPDESLCAPMDPKDFGNAQKQLLETASWFKKPNRYQNQLEERYRWKLSMVRLTPRRRSKGWSMVWEIGTLEAAMYLMLSYDAFTGGLLTLCGQCQRPFLSTRKQALYCSHKCYNRHKVAACRNRQKKQLS